MQRIFLTIAVFASAFLCACAESNDKTANKEYVKAAQKVSEAKIAFDAADYDTALSLCLQARDDVSKIISQYPETSIALKVVTDASTLIGACSYAELNDTVIPKLKLFSEESMRNCDIAWSIALSMPLSERDTAISQIAKNIVNSKNFSDRDKNAILACAREMSSASGKSSVLQLMRDKLAKKSDPAKTEESVKAAPQVLTKIANEKIFIAQSNNDASLVEYDMQAVENLRAKAELAKDASEGLKSEFSKSLKAAQSNSMKISSPDMREKSLATIALAFATLGEESNAISIAQSLQNPTLFANVFDAIAKAASSGKNYTLAIALSSKLPDGDSKNGFLIELCKGVANQGLPAEAGTIASAIKSAAARNAAYAGVAQVCLLKGDAKNFAESIAKIDLSESDTAWLDAFNFAKEDASGKILAESEGFYLGNKAALPALQSALLTKTLIENSAEEQLTASVNAKALALCEAIDNSNRYDFSQISGIICSNLAAIGKTEEALKYVVSNIHRSQESTAFENTLAIAAITKNPKLAREAFAAAANLCASLQNPSTVRTEGVIDLSMLLQSSGIGRAECAKMLKPFLPDFK